jgi:hypothetical protein
MRTMQKHADDSASLMQAKPVLYFLLCYWIEYCPALQEQCQHCGDKANIISKVFDQKPRQQCIHHKYVYFTDYLCLQCITPYITIYTDFDDKKTEIAKGGMVHCQIPLVLGVELSSTQAKEGKTCVLATEAKSINEFYDCIAYHIHTSYQSGENIKEQSHQEWSAKNGEHRREYMRTWEAQHAEERKAYNRQWKAMHPEKVKESKQRSWLKKKGTKEYKEYQHQQYMKHREKRSEYYKARYAENPEKTKERVASWRTEHPEKYREKQRRYREKNREKIREYQRQYMAKKKAAKDQEMTQSP